METFKAHILKAGINPYVNVPARVSRVFNRRGYIPVLVHVGEGHVRSTLVPTGGGRHRLYINNKMRLLVSADVGDSIGVGLTIDEANRTPSMPADLVRQLAAHPGASKSWEHLTPSRRKEILTYLNHLKRRETLIRKIDDVISRLESQTGHRG